MLKRMKLKNIKSTLLLCLVLLVMVSLSTKISAVGIGKTFSEQFPNQNTATTIASTFNKLPTDEIDSADIGITDLYLNGSNLTDIRGIEIFSDLKYLDLSSNQITNLPDDFYTLTNLVSLDLSRNKIQEISGMIGNLNKLTYLDLGVNEMIMIPSEIGTLSSLQTLMLYNNQLTSLPLGLEGLTSLNYISLQTNLLPSNYAVTLNQLGFGFTIPSSAQLELMISNPTSFTINDEDDLDDINFSSFLKLNLNIPLASEHTYRFENYHDEMMQPVAIEDYIKDGVVIKTGTIYAQVRATGAGLFPNTSDNALTQDSVELIFEAETYNVSFNLNGAVGEKPASQSVAEGSLVSAVQEPSRDGYSFLNWNTLQNGNGTIWDFETTPMPAYNITLYAQWQKKEIPNPKEYEVTFDLNGSKGSAPKSQLLQEGSKVIKPVDPSRAGYIFKGWNTLQNGQGTLWNFEINKVGAQDITLYAMWIKDNELPQTGTQLTSLYLIGSVLMLSGYIMIRKNKFK